MVCQVIQNVCCAFKYKHPKLTLLTNNSSNSHDPHVSNHSHPVNYGDAISTGQNLNYIIQLQSRDIRSVSGICRISHYPVLSGSGKIISPSKFI